MSSDLQTRPDVPPLPRAARFGPVLSFVLRPWPVLVSGVLAAGTFVVFCLSIRLGDFPLSFVDVVRAIFGQGDSVTVFIVHDLRMPRALVGVLVGAALGMSGAIVQSIARNPLASPDILGITAGAGVLAVFLVTSTGGLAAAVTEGVGLPAASLVGGLLTGVLVYVLAFRGGIDGMRLILIGVAITALMQALITWMIVRADIRDAARAQTWLVGSLEARTWSQVTAVAVVGGIAAVVALGAAFALKAVQLGDDVARGLGVPLTVTRAVLLIAAVLLAAIAVSASGPIAFVAFVSPQVAMRLTRLPAPPLIPAALTGAFLLTGADLVARVILPVQLPVGIVTAGVGGPFLVYLLVRNNLKASKK
ncbi:iron chelate uptake ABC transporter family permease subunit [Tsukamurella sp. 8F]|uniref:FecCD family ABC transporter permease n=1 Tax=unclassified Tsukamurella TaxID=2633480 RepID=UPI0023B9E787|nr:MULTISPECIES: iron chelate uptake ABC transporter family permease subunit [unclassified Tsukamurella]MDF0529540.1 iron chelate uptake ABC transporter family permease subunit [Tsukamurella sp. 8J]MDF0585772.1 iron chelate uptake ABC transporter family permease subunit [Tsukamurella sp. 8F]